MGRKYIIEIIGGEEGDMDFSTIEPYTEPGLEQVRKEAYDKGYDDAAEEKYNDGLADAWEAARKIYLPIEYGGIPADVLRQIFNNKSASGIFKKVSASEAVEKIRRYEQEKEEIQVGDEVIPRETEYDTMIVTRLWKDDYDSDCIDAIGFDGRISSFLVSRVSKTGKHCEIAEVLQKMKES